MDKGVEFGLESGDAHELVIEKLERRKLFGAEEFGDLRQAGGVKRGHGPEISRVSVRLDGRQGNLASKNRLCHNRNALR